MAVNYGKKAFSVLGERRKPKFRNLIHTPTYLVCNAHLKINLLSLHMSLVVVMNWGTKMRYIGLKWVCFDFI